MYHKKQGNLRLTVIFSFRFCSRFFTISWSSVGAPVQWAYGCRWYFSFFSSLFSGIRGRGTCRSYNKDRPLTVLLESDNVFKWRGFCVAGGALTKFHQAPAFDGNAFVQFRDFGVTFVSGMHILCALYLLRIEAMTEKATNHAFHIFLFSFINNCVCAMIDKLRSWM